MKSINSSSYRSIPIGLLLGSCLSGGVGLCFAQTLPPVIARQNLEGVRQDETLESGWRFTKDKEGDQKAEGSDFDDSAWQLVSIPHCWGWEEAQKGDNYYRGAGWYRRELETGAPQKGKRYFLRFEAASTVANVFLNGKSLGEHRGGFAAFCYEITGQINATGKNQLAVRVSNAAAKDIGPISGDFPVYGGLYRPVHLIVTNEQNFDLTNHASPGVTWLQSRLAPGEAELSGTVQITNRSKEAKDFTLVSKVLTSDGSLVTSKSQAVNLTPECKLPFWFQLTVNKPHLWNGRQDPYLYRAIVELRTPTGLVDSVEQPLGLRSTEIDPVKGFFLNNKPYRLQGVCRHQDRAGKGWAISEADMKEDLDLIKEMGANAIRLAHYQHSETIYRLCDEAGLLVWTEIPLVDQIDASIEFEQTSQSQLRELIRQNINHPCVFGWGLFNEIGNKKTPSPERLIQNLNAIAHGEDPTRPTLSATCMLKMPQLNKISDVLGWNNYPLWYSKPNYPQALDMRQESSRLGGFSLSEYGAGANPNHHEQDPQRPKTTGQWHPEEWQNIAHEAAWPEIKARPFVWGSFIWNMFDFTSYWRNEGGVKGLNNKGLVTHDRKLKKDAFYYYKANWSSEPVVYISSRRFTQRTQPTTEVKIYSNAEEVELFVNGKRQASPLKNATKVFLWKNVTLQPGQNKIEAHAKVRGKSLVDSCEWELNS